MTELDNEMGAQPGPTGYLKQEEAITSKVDLEDVTSPACFKSQSINHNQR